MVAPLLKPPPPGNLITSDGKISTAFDNWLRNLTDNTAAAQSNIAASQDAITALQGATTNDVITGFIPFVANQDYVLLNYAPFPITVLSTITWCTAGTCTAVFKKNGSAIAGVANAVSISRVLQPRSATFAAADYMTMTLSANANCRNMSFAVIYSRPLLVS